MFDLELIVFIYTLFTHYAYIKMWLMMCEQLKVTCQKRDNRLLYKNRVAKSIWNNRKNKVSKVKKLKVAVVLLQNIINVETVERSFKESVKRSFLL